jgi:hypothetical protein
VSFSKMLFSEKGKEQPLGEQSWPEMSYWDTTPVEHTFPDPMILHGCPNVDERTSHPARDFQNRPSPRNFLAEKRPASVMNPADSMRGRLMPSGGPPSPVKSHGSRL